MITPSEVMEYLYCPRFTYFLNCLDIPQHEEQRYKVEKAKHIHDLREKHNREYLRKKIDCVNKLESVFMSSESVGIKGIVDEILFFRNGTAAPLDYKYSEYKGKIYQTQKYQSAMYGLLIKERFKVEVHKGYICFIRSKNALETVELSQDVYRETLDIIERIMHIMLKGFFPKRTGYKSRCIDCCYRNICIK